MFKGRVISRSNINGKVHTFQKDFDDYESYRSFIEENPDFNTSRLFENVFHPLQFWSGFPFTQNGSLLTNQSTLTKYLPEWVNLEKYEKRREEKRIEQVEKAEKKQTLEKSKSYLMDYMNENPDDTEAREDLEKIEQELIRLTA